MRQKSVIFFSRDFERDRDRHACSEQSVSPKLDQRVSVYIIVIIYAFTTTRVLLKKRKKFLIYVYLFFNLVSARFFRLDVSEIRGIF